MSRQQHHPADLVFSAQELAELGARLASGTPSLEEETLVLPRLRPSPFDLLVETAFAAEESRRRGSAPPQPPRSEPLPAPASGPSAPPMRRRQTGPIASSPPPLRFRSHSSPPRAAPPREELEVPVDLRATQPDLPALGADDSPFSSGPDAAGPPPVQRAASVAALAAAVSGRPAERADLPTIDEIMSSSPPPTAGGAKVAVAVAGGGSMPDSRVSAIEALSRAVQELLPTPPGAPSAHTPALLALDDSELDVLEEEDEETSRALAETAVPPARTEAPPPEPPSLLCPPPPLLDASERTPPEARPAAVEAVEPPLPPPLPRPQEDRVAPEPAEVEPAGARTPPPAPEPVAPPGGPEAVPSHAERAAAVPPPAELDAELEMLRSLAAPEEGLEELEITAPPAAPLEAAVPGAMDIVPVPTASTQSAEIEDLVPGSGGALEPAVAEAPARLPPPAPRRRTPPLGLPIQPPAQGEAGLEPSAAPLSPEPRDLVFDATEPPVHLPPSVESRRPPRIDTTEPIRTGSEAHRTTRLTPEPPPRREPPLRSMPPPPEPEGRPAAADEAARAEPRVAPRPPPPRSAGPPPAPTPRAPAVSAPPPIPAPTPRAPAVSAPPPPPAAEEGRPRKRRRGKPWFEEIFDEDYLRTLPYLTPRQTEQEVHFILESLELPPGSRVLDVACGYGRHAMEMAARGHRVVGIDLSLPLLIRAADAARRVGVTVDFVHGDMRDMTFDSEFDAAYCYFTSFGYFDDDTNRRVAAGICRALRPGGRFLLDLINRDYLIGDLPARVWWQGDGCVVLEEVDFNYFTSRLQVQRQIILEDGRQLEQEISIRTYSLHEIGKILHHAGFRVLEVSGGRTLRGRFFGADSRQILVLAEKRSD